MREILFRGKRVDKNEWTYGSYLPVPNTICTQVTYPNSTEYIDLFVIPETVGQFTGLLDKNGKKIFEGDIVRLNEDVKRTFGVDDGVVKYIGGCFIVTNGNSVGTRGSLYVITDINWTLRGEVIGNIHDDPELLKGE